MKRINIIVLIIIIFNITLLQAYDWPIKEDTTQHIITSVMGECRSIYQGSVIEVSIMEDTEFRAIILEII